MRSRSTTLTVIAVALAGFGVYVGSYVPGLLVGQSSIVLLACFVAQTVCALAAAIGVWRGQSWASGVVVALGVAVAVTSLVEAFVLGLVAYLYALLVAVVAIVIALLIAAYVNRPARLA